MRISEIVEKTGLKGVNQFSDREIESVYISDMVSDIITGAKAGSMVITLQTHKSLIASANLARVAMLVIVKGRKPAEDVVELASRAGIAVFVSDDDAWTFARKIADLGFK